MRPLHDIVAHLVHPRRSNNHRARIIHPEGFLLLFLIAGAFTLGLKILSPRTSLQSSILGYSSSITSQKVIDETNAQRAKIGLSSLTPNEQLTQAAYAKAQDMFKEQYWAHYSPSGKSPWDFMRQQNYTYSVAGENLARDFIQPEDMMTAWMNSPTHKENIVNPRYNQIGIAVVNGVLQGVETTLVVQMFGTPRTGVTTVGEVPSSARNVEVEQVPVPAAETPVIAQVPSQNVLAVSLQRLNLVSGSPLLSPLHLSKALFLGMIIMILFVLIYDYIIATNNRTIRFVGKNFGHIALFTTILYLIVVFESGLIL
jgi:uncharacterized protein YkwD